MSELTNASDYVIRTSGENIGDTVLIQAYRAWQNQVKTSFDAGKEDLLPGLNFTRYIASSSITLDYANEIFVREQLFFISFARIWARAMKPAAAVS